MSLYRVIRAYGPWSVGHVFTDMPGNVGRMLSARGLVKLVADDQPSPENRMLSAAEPVQQSYPTKRYKRR